MAFETGKSGNPNGRPKGSGYRQQIFNDLVLPHKEALLEKAIGMAKDGDPQMLKLLLERILPAKPTDEPIAFDLPSVIDYRTREEIANHIVRSTAEMLITPDEANKILKMLAESKSI